VTHGSHEVGRTGRTVNQTIALAFGVIYTLVGIAGFFVTGDVPFAGKEGDPVILFDVNGLHNIVHLLIGVALIAAAKRHDTARGANLAIGVTYLALGVLGPLITDTALNVVALNGADHVLHLASGALLTAVALLADKTARARA
jgi:hypothetical protein